MNPCTFLMKLFHDFDCFTHTLIVVMNGGEGTCACQ